MTTRNVLVGILVAVLLAGLDGYIHAQQATPKLQTIPTTKPAPAKSSAKTPVKPGANPAAKTAPVTQLPNNPLYQKQPLSHPMPNTPPASPQGAAPVLAPGQPAFAMPQPSEVSENVLIILDASYSMAEPSGEGGTKMAAAKRAIMQLLAGLPPTTRVGFRVYGNSTNAFTACTATDLLVPIGPNNTPFIEKQLFKLQPTGATPISHTLKVALQNDFNNINGNKSVILVSDGMETCDQDPCEVSVQMQRLGVNVKVNVIGFGIHEPEALKQLKCVAMATFGKFYTADTAAELANRMSQAVSAQKGVAGRILVPGSSR